MDRRHSAYPHFTHYIEDTWRKSGENVDINFFTLREWFWAQLGPSKEWRYWYPAQNSYPGKRSININWCWDTEFGKQRIYVTEHAIILFNLKWI